MLPAKIDLRVDDATVGDPPGDGPVDFGAVGRGPPDDRRRARPRFSYLTVSWPSEGRARLEKFIEQVMPDITG